MGEIILECGSKVLIDNEDYDYIVNFYDLHIDKHGYVQCSIKKKYKHKKMGLYSRISLHKLLMFPEKVGRGIDVDHIEGNKLDNRKSMLRVCAHKDNMKNRKVQNVYAKQETSSKYKGVYWHKRDGLWGVEICSDKNRIFIGNFTNEIAGANAYNYYAKLYHLDFALLNDCPHMPYDEWIKYKCGKEKSSKYIGVSINKSNGLYKAQIWDGDAKKNIQLGEFEKESDAALAYNQKALELRGNKAKLNTINNT